MKLSFAIIISVILLVGTVNAAPLQYTSNACNGNQLCATTTVCDINAGGCKTTTTSCQSCPAKNIFCPDGSPATCPGVCQSSGGVASCGECTPICSSSQARDTVVLEFNVYTKKNLNVSVTPNIGKGIAGRSIDYGIKIQNSNPFDVSLLPQLQLPSGWISSDVAPFTLKTGQSIDINITVTSNRNATEGLYPILLALFSNEIGTVIQNFRYQVSNNAEPTITIMPNVQNSVSGGSVNFTVEVMNNNGPEFDAASVLITVSVPEGWLADQPSVTKIASGETKNFSVIVTVNDTPIYGSNKIKVNATMFSLNVGAEASVFISNCGDNVCQQGEVCSADCPVEPKFRCSGRCERQTDTGVTVSTSLNNFVSTKFIVCDANSTEQDCESSFDSGSCGPGNACLCGNSPSSVTSCSFRCVDGGGAYYMTSRGITEGTIESAGNYEYKCPIVNLNEIIQTRDNLVQSKDQFEQSRSVLKENIASSQNKGEFIPCYNGLGLIIDNLTTHIGYLDKVIQYPAVSNTTEARLKTRQIRNMISSVYSQYCRGTSGILKITNTQIPLSVEKNSNANVSVEIQNQGSSDTYGLTQCDFTSPSGTIITKNNTCENVQAGTTHSYRMLINVNDTGDWKVSCKISSSLKTDCTNGLVNDQTQISTFNVYSREAFISSVQATCNQNVLCSVTTSRQTNDVSCAIRNSTCLLMTTNGNTVIFNCTKPGVGIFNATGSVLTTANTIAVDPSSQTSSFSCQGVGDNVVSSQEQCEPVNTYNNTFCAQSAWICNGTLTGRREANGFCGSNAQCVPSNFVYSCSAPSCGATCSDGATNNYTFTNSEGRTCVCLQQCGSSCSFNSCSCEIPPKQLFFNQPSDGIVISGNTFISAFASYESAVNFGISSLSNTCLGQYSIPSINTLPNIFEAVLNTTNYSDGRYYLCVKSSTNVTSINIYISNNGTYTLTNLTNKALIITSPIHNSIVNGTINVSVFANYENSLNLGFGSDPTCSGQYIIQTIKITGDRYIASIDTTMYQDNRYFLCAKSSTNLTIISVVVKNNNNSVVNTTPVYIAPNNTVTDQPINQSCTVVINSKSCVYNSATNRYTISTGILWYGGNHSHVYIEGDEGPKLTEMTATRTYTVTGAGSKSIIAHVHGNDDISLCRQATTVDCPVVSNDNNQGGYSQTPGDNCINTQVEKYLSPAKNCQSFRVCEAPAGWTRVDKCPSEIINQPVQQVEKKDPIFLIMIAIILIVIMVFIIVFRKDIYDWIQEHNIEKPWSR